MLIARPTGCSATPPPVGSRSPVRSLLLYSEGASSLPWEMLQHIYSHCDTCTLAVLCLVSFESWKMAGPVLYEHVDLKSVDGVKAFFFLVSTKASFRASSPAVCRLSLPLRGC